MTLPILQVAALMLLCGAAYAWLQRRSSSSTGTRAVFLLAVAGGAARSVAFAALFLISWLNLPFGRSLQLGSGFWFFALDGIVYFQVASSAADDGIPGILAVSRTHPSPFYIRTLGLATYWFGQVASVALLINLIAYGVCVWAAIHFAGANGLATRRLKAVIVLIAAGPGLTLWALQPLKDPLAWSLTAIVFISFGALMSSSRRAAIYVAPVAMLAAIYGIAGIRWYVAFLIAACLAAAMLYTAALRLRRVTPPFIAAAAVVMVSPWIALIECAPYVPEPLKNAMLLRSEPGPAAPEQLLGYLPSARAGFELSGGTTQIRSPIDEGDSEPLAPSTTAIPAPAGEGAASAPSQGAERTESSVEAAPHTGEPPSATGTPSMAEAQSSAASHSEAAQADGAAGFGNADRPDGIVRQLGLGLAAFTVPRFMARPLKLFDAGGSNAMWLFADLSTVVFSSILIFFAFSLRRIWRTAVNDPLFVAMALFAIVLGILQAYVITNFGTLFRLRSSVEMVLLMMIARTAFFAREPRPQPQSQRADVEL